MPRPVNQRCLECASLPTDEAHQRSCWDAKRCHDRRSHYRVKLEREHQSDEKLEDGGVPVVDVPLKGIIQATLYQYTPADSRALHAVRAELYRDGQLILKTKPIHTGGLTERVLKTYLEEVLKTFSRYANTPILLFRHSVTLPLDRHRCPVEGCYLNPSNSLTR